MQQKAKSTYVSIIEFQLHKQDTQTQSTKKGLINKQEYNTINHPTDTISNGLKTLPDSL